MNKNSNNVYKSQFLGSTQLLRDKGSAKVLGRGVTGVLEMLGVDAEAVRSIASTVTLFQPLVHCPQLFEPKQQGNLHKCTRPASWRSIRSESTSPRLHSGRSRPA